MTTFQVYRLREMPSQVKDRIMKRSRLDLASVNDEVRRILDDVKSRGDEAIAEFLSTQTGRAVKVSDIRVEESDVKRAYGELDGDFVQVLKHFISNVKKFHRMQMPKSFLNKIEKGVYAGQIVVPLNSAGLYVPSGKARYPSVAGMIATAAKVAGVNRIALACPPGGDEMKIDPATLVAAHLSGANEFYVMGGAHAIAAFAYGTGQVKQVEAIAGPGGPYTYAAKRMVADLVRLDLPAGPSEGMVLSDGSVRSTQVALDLLNEAEHGPDSAGILVTTSYEFGAEVSEAIDRILQDLPEPRRGYVKENAKKFSVIVVCDGMEEAVRFINEYSPEHLAVDSKRARLIMRKYRPSLRNFGTVCVNTPISAGNFGIGPNSTLPTGGYARLFSGLSVDAFLRKPTVEEIRGKEWKKFARMVITLANYEGFPSHAKAMESYLKNN